MNNHQNANKKNMNLWEKRNNSLDTHICEEHERRKRGMRKKLFLVVGHKYMNRNYLKAQIFEQKILENANIFTEDTVSATFSA